MKTCKTDLPRSVNRENELFIKETKKPYVRIKGDGYIVRELSYEDCESLAAHANNEKIWNNLMDHFPHPYTPKDAFDYIRMVKAISGWPMRLAIEINEKAVGSIGFGSEVDVEKVTAEIGYWLGEEFGFYACFAKSGVPVGSYSS